MQGSSSSSGAMPQPTDGHRGAAAPAALAGHSEASPLDAARDAVEAAPALLAASASAEPAAEAEANQQDATGRMVREDVAEPSSYEQPTAQPASSTSSHDPTAPPRSRRSHAPARKPAHARDVARVAAPAPTAAGAPSLVPLAAVMMGLAVLTFLVRRLLRRAPQARTSDASGATPPAAVASASASAKAGGALRRKKSAPDAEGAAARKGKKVRAPAADSAAVDGADAAGTADGPSVSEPLVEVPLPDTLPVLRLQLSPPTPTPGSTGHVPLGMGPMAGLRLVVSEGLDVMGLPTTHGVAPAAATVSTGGSPPAPVAAGSSAADEGLVAAAGSSSGVAEEAAATSSDATPSSEARGGDAAEAAAAPAGVDPAAGAASTAAAVRQMLAGGAVLVGKAAEQPLSLDGGDLVGANFGNPANKLRAAGGGCTGAVVAVATGVADVALGTDYLGQLRVPAACCGVLSYRPSPVSADGPTGSGFAGGAVSVVARDASVLLRAAQALGAPGNRDLRGELIKFVVAEDMFALCGPELQPALVALKKSIVRWAGADQAGSVQLCRYLAGNTTAWQQFVPADAADSEASAALYGGAVPPVLEALRRAAEVLQEEEICALLPGLAAAPLAADAAPPPAPTVNGAAAQPEATPAADAAPAAVDAASPLEVAAASDAAQEAEVAAAGAAAAPPPVAAGAASREEAVATVADVTPAAPDAVAEAGAEDATPAEDAAAPPAPAPAQSDSAVPLVAAAEVEVSDTAGPAEAAGLQDPLAEGAAAQPGAVDAAPGDSAATAGAGAQEAVPAAAAGASAAEAAEAAPAAAAAAAVVPFDRLATARQAAREVFECFRTTVKGDTMFIIPALPFVPPRRTDARGPEGATFARLAQCFCCLPMLAACPSVTIPVGNLLDGTPLSVTMFAVHRFDMRLLAVAHKLLPMVQFEFAAVKADLAQRYAAAALASATPSPADAPADADAAVGAAANGQAPKRAGKEATKAKKVVKGAPKAAAAAGGAAPTANGNGSAAAAPPAVSDAEAARRVERAEKHKAKGNELFKANRFADAVTEYGRAINEIPGGSAVYFSNRAMANLKIFRFEQAEEDCDRALKFDLKEADRVKALLRRATARTALDKFSPAEADLKLVLNLEPNNRQARDDLAELRTRREEMQSAQLRMVQEYRAAAEAAGGPGAVPNGGMGGYPAGMLSGGGHANGGANEMGDGAYEDGAGYEYVDDQGQPIPHERAMQMLAAGHTPAPPPPY